MERNMYNTNKEQLSSLLDDELEPSETKELIEALERDDGLNKQFDRFALIRDALNEDVVVYQDSFLKSVQKALAEEPTVLAPNRSTRENKGYIAAALAASFAFFTVALFDIDVIGSATQPFQSSASADFEQDEMLAYEELIFEELEEQENTLQNEDSTTVQFVTFEK